MRPNERDDVKEMATSQTANDNEQEDYRSECATGTAKVSDELTVSR